MSAPEIVLIAAVLVGMSVQAAVGFGFAFFAAPAAFAAFPPAEAVMLVLVLALGINCLVLFGERRRARVAGCETAILVAAAIPGMLAGAWVVTEVEREALQMLVGLIVLAGAAVQWRIASRPLPVTRNRAPTAEVVGGLAAGALTTSVSVNGPVLVLTFSHLGLRGAALRDSLAAALLGLTLPAALIVAAFADGGSALPPAWIVAACAPAVLVGHRFGAALFRRLDDASHHRAAIAAAALAGLLSIAVALV